MQKGSLIRRSRKHGPGVWVFRWSEKDADGRRIYRKRVVGTVEQYPEAEAARGSMATLIAKVNSANQRSVTQAMTFGQLCAHFEQRELARDNTWRSYATKKCYAVYLRRWIVPQWGKFRLSDIRTIQGGLAAQPGTGEKQLCQNPQPDVRRLQSRLPVRVL